MFLRLYLYIYTFLDILYNIYYSLCFRIRTRTCTCMNTIATKSHLSHLGCTPLLLINKIDDLFEWTQNFDRVCKKFRDSAKFQTYDQRLVPYINCWQLNGTMTVDVSADLPNSKLAH